MAGSFVDRFRAIFTRIDGAVLFLILVLGLLLWLVVGSNPTGGISAALLVSLASALTGALLGFIFAVPRRVHGIAVGERGTRPEEMEAGGGSRPSSDQYDANTSLEDICDWLTKIIVGVGLVEARQIGDMLVRIGRSVEAGAFGRTTDGVLGTSTIIAFAVLGFLISFLWFRQNLMIAWQSSHYGNP